MESSLVDLARFSLTLAGLVVGGRLGRCLDAPLVGEIVAGLLLGPDGVGLVPEPSAWVLVGNLGLVLLVMEGALHIDVTSLRRVGPVAVIIAVVGTVLPIALGTGYMVAAGYDPETGVAAGTSLSSTSIGMATAMMSRVGELNTPLGSLICVAAMVDDILSLVILAVVATLGTGADSGAASAVAARVARPVLVSLAVVLLGRLAFAVVPTVVDAAKRRTEPEHHRELTLVAMLVLTLGLTLASGAAGSTFLLGAFAGGFAFARDESARDAWRSLEDPVAWLHSVFFLAVGTQIPLKHVFSARGFGLGVGYAVPAVAGKIVTGCFLAPDWIRARIVGWAMVGRGELGFVMARQAKVSGLMGDVPYVACVWALLVATLASPVFMRRALERLRRDEHVAAAAEVRVDGDAMQPGPRGWRLRGAGTTRPGRAGAETGRVEDAVASAKR